MTRSPFSGLFLIVATGVALTGCANTANMRTLANLTAKKVADHRRQIDDFVAAQNDVNSAAAAELSSFSAATAVANADRTLLTDRWDVMEDKTRQHAYAAASAVTAQSILDSLTVAEVKPTSVKADTADKQLNVAAKALQALAAKPGFMDQVREIVAAGQQVQAAVDKARKAATTTPAPAVAADAKPAAKS